MAYLVDRSRALYVPEIVAIVSVRQRKICSRVIMKDNSLYHTLTRPQALARHSQNPAGLRARRRRNA
jgi:hypothetical protein